MAAQEKPMTSVGPHEYKPLGKWRHRDRCRSCYLHEGLHPTKGWHEARPLGDTRRHPW